LALLKKPQPLTSILGASHFVTDSLKEPPKEIYKIRIVVDDQQICRIVPPVAHVAPVVWSAPIRQLEVNDKGRSSIEFQVDRDPTPARLHDSVDDRKPKTVPETPITLGER